MAHGARRRPVDKKTKAKGAREACMRVAFDRTEVSKGEAVTEGDHERGASLVEYALLVALVAVVCMAALIALAGSAAGHFDQAGHAAAGGGPVATGCYNYNTGPEPIHHVAYAVGTESDGIPGSCP